MPEQRAPFLRSWAIAIIGRISHTDWRIVPTTLRQRLVFNRLALAAALLFAVWQGLSLQHLHAGEPLQAECAICAAAQHDDVVPGFKVVSVSRSTATDERVEFHAAQPTTDTPSIYGARAPPTR